MNTWEDVLAFAADVADWLNVPSFKDVLPSASVRDLKRLLRTIQFMQDEIKNGKLELVEIDPQDPLA